jgi:hypothetical protein
MGSGFLTKESHLTYDIESWLKKFRRNSREFGLIIKCHPFLAEKLKAGKLGSLLKFQLKYFVRLQVEEDETVPQGRFKFISKKTGTDLTDKFL